MVGPALKSRTYWDRFGIERRKSGWENPRQPLQAALWIGASLSPSHRGAWGRELPAPRLEAEVEGSAEPQEEGLAEPEVGGSTEPVIKESAEVE
ncbi:hypothetical protein Sjap_000657 [Stephania japonica]|uniref:Uncharacterized protein n=1 Tax=Stephania japonica TaxID=461633 RepID=A0AAP0KIH9_9MAGN